MFEAKIYKDNQEPPKNVIWHKVSDAGQDLGYYKNTNNKWNKIDINEEGLIHHIRYDWVSGASYGKEDIVFHKGSSYIALSDNPSTEPSFTYDPATGSYNVSAGWGLLAVGATIVQETGDSQDKVMSQKTVTDALTASDQKLSELNSLIALVENSEYAEILIDDDYKILEVVTKQGTRIFFGGLNIKGEFIPETLKIADEIYSPIDSNVYLELMIDSEGKIISSLIPDGTHYFAKLKSPTIDAIINRLDAIDVNSLLPWNGKYAVFYGDSVTASSNPGEIAPFDAGSVKWATMVARKLGLREYKCRGIGGATWSPMNKIAYIAPNGEPAENTITNYTKETAPHKDGYTIVDGGLSTWERITNQIPSSIREDVDLVFVFCNNQEPSGEFSPSYSTSDVWDTLWKNDVTFNPFGGDYNIADCGNAIVSTIQKLQAWCPNARVVIGTGVSGRGSNDAHNTTDLSLSMSLQGKQEIVKRVANTISTPCIDIWGTDGINIFNRSKYIKDGVHPNNDGNVELANAIAAGLSVIYPKKYRIWNVF